jgi:hypothetical protein
MRLLIYAMESSGASTFCYFLGQLPGSVAIIDVWSRCITPPLRLDVPVVAKATTTMAYRAADHIASFAPDKIILFIRDPVAIYSSLHKYSYADTFGSIEEKLSRFDAEFGCLKVDLVLKYEDFIARDPNLVPAIRSLGWGCCASYFECSRTLEDIRRFNIDASPWLKNNYRKGWGLGNIRGDTITDTLETLFPASEIMEKIVSLSPRLSQHYGYSGETA